MQRPSTETLLLLVGYWCLAHAICGTVVGRLKERGLVGGLLGLLFGPIGVVAAFALDGRPTCPMCEGRLDASPRKCPHCRAELQWERPHPGMSDFTNRRAVLREPPREQRPHPAAHTTPPA
jgi:hypothetical protein